MNINRDRIAEHFCRDLHTEREDLGHALRIVARDLAIQMISIALIYLAIVWTLDLHDGDPLAFATLAALAAQRFCSWIWQSKGLGRWVTVDVLSLYDAEAWKDAPECVCGSCICSYCLKHRAEDHESSHDEYEYWKAQGKA